MRISIAPILVAATATLLPAHAPAHAPALAGQRRVLRAWFARRDLPVPRPDPVLDRVALRNSRALAELSPPAGRPVHGVSAYLDFLLERQGVRDAVVQAAAFHLRGPGSFDRQARAFLARNVAGGGMTHYGLGLAGAGGRRLVTLILVRRRVRVEAVLARPGQPLRVCCRTLSGRHPRVMVTTPDGRILERAPVLGGPQFCVRFPPARKGVHRLEVMVDGDLGPEVAALFPLYVGLPPPAMPVHKIYPAGEIRRQQVETRLLLRVNDAREKAGLPRLTPHLGLARVARAHSLEMVRQGYFGHRSPSRGGLARRLAAAGLGQIPASENLALASGPAQAHDALMLSPSHRRNILDPNMTHLGVGAAYDARQALVYFTQIFARPHLR